MKKVYVFMAFLAVCNISYGKAVNENTAREAGFSYLSGINASAAKSESDLSLVYAPTAVVNGHKVTDFYVFNSNSSNSFVIVSGDDNIKPVLGYSTESSFVLANMPDNISNWFKGYERQINAVIAANMEQTTEMQDTWTDLLQNKAANPHIMAKTTSVSPLLHTSWDQEPYYNVFCPTNTVLNQQAVTGCVATAMAQVMKYWNWPLTGMGSNSYDSYNSSEHYDYGTQSVGFDTTTYDWGAMFNSISSNNGPIGLLMYDAGVSVNMDYGTAESDGSGAWVRIAETYGSPNCAEYALKTYFNYVPTLHGEARSSYTDADWIALMQNEINSSRPIVYEGYGNLGGHCFVADGYDNNENFHFNWGWSGMDDGYYSIDDLDPASLGGDNFNSDEGMVIGIYPNNGIATVKLVNAISVSQNTTTSDTVRAGQAVTVNLQVGDIGSVTFTGDLDVSLFDITGATQLFTIQQLQGQSIPADGNAHSFTFTNSNLNIAPGTYKLMLRHKFDTGANFIQTTAVGFQNPITVTVLSPLSLPAANSANAIKIYPNPSSDVVNIDLQQYQNNVSEIRIVDIQGKLMSKTSVSKNALITIPVNGFAPGTYFVELQTNTGVQSQKINVQ